MHLEIEIEPVEMGGYTVRIEEVEDFTVNTTTHESYAAAIGYLVKKLVETHPNQTKITDYTGENDE